MASPLKSQHGASGLSLVDAIVEDPALVKAFTELAPETIVALVRRVGLEDSGSLLTLATPTQLKGLADDELWRSEPGREETFDAERFGLLVEVLFMEGAGAAADALMELSDDLLALALADHMHVLDADALAPLMTEGHIEDSELIDKILESRLLHELDEFLLLSKIDAGWDALIEVLHELSNRDHSRLRRLLERASAATMSRVDSDGLYQVLSESQTLEEDVRAERNDRREARGYVAGADARAFLAAADAIGAGVASNPVTLGFLRRHESAQPGAPQSDAVGRLLDRLRSLEVVPETPRLAAIASGSSETRRQLGRLRDGDPDRHTAQLRELLFLANVLMAGVYFDDRPMGRVDAIHASLAVCDAGRTTMPESEAATLGPVQLFGAGWQALSRQELLPLRGQLAEARSLRRRMRSS